MRKESSLPVRLETESKKRLVEISERTGLTVSSLIRMLVKSFIATYDSNGGRVVLPPAWQTTTVKSAPKERKKAAK